MLPRTARTARHEGARCHNARSPRHTTMRTKHCHAGRPELTRRAHIDAKPGRRERRETAKKLLCRLTLELSGGEAVRLERNVRHRYAIDRAMSHMTTARKVTPKSSEHADRQDCSSGRWMIAAMPHGIATT